MSTETQTAGAATGELRPIAAEAYVHLDPLVTMEITRRQMSSLPDGVRPGFGTANAIDRFAIGDRTGRRTGCRRRAGRGA